MTKSKQKTLNGKNADVINERLDRILQELFYLRENIDIIRTQTTTATQKVGIPTRWQAGEKREAKPQPVQLTDETAKQVRWDGAWKFDLLADFLETPIFAAVAAEFKGYGYVWSKKHHAFFKPKEMKP